MEIRAYCEDYLPGAQAVLGHAFDFAIMTLGVEPCVFGMALAVCEGGRQFSTGNPSVIAGQNGCEFARMILDESGFSYEDAEDAMYLDKSPEYWAGWALAYYQWRTSRSFMDILTVAPPDDVLEMYPIYHEMDIERFCERIDELMRQAHPHTRLRERRDVSELSQAELAAEAGVPVRQIQLFEQRQRDINKASAMTLLKLSRALHCRMEDLIEL